MKNGRLFTTVLLALFGIPSRANIRSLEFETSQVTGAHMTVAPDGQTLVFTMLGHLFSVPTSGGTTVQLTFGPNYDTRPAFSPDGSQVAFISDRGGGEYNIFILSMKTREVVQLTHEYAASRAVWSPDGKSIIYLRYKQAAGEWPAVVAKISARGGEPEILTAPPKRMGQPFYLLDGRLAWTTRDQDWQSNTTLTQIEVLNRDGTTSTLRTIPGAAFYVVPAPGGNGFYCYRVTGSSDEIIFLPATGEPEKRIVPVTAIGRFAMSTDGTALYMGDQGHLWKVHLPRGDKQPLAFAAHVKLDVQEISQPTTPSLSPPGTVREIGVPRLSPDGRTLVFGAAGFLWKQILGGGKAQRISRETALESEPTFSPDGHQLAYVQSQYGVDSLRLLDLDTGQNRILASGPGISELAWSSDGQRILAVTVTELFPDNIVAFNVADGKRERLAAAGNWSRRPQFSADGRAIFYSADNTGVGNLYRLTLSKDAKAEQITHLTRHLSDARVSPDEKWVVFRRNHSILIASLESGSVGDSDVHELAQQGGDSVAFTPDGSSVIYAAGRRVWRQPLAGGPRQEIPIALELPGTIAPPLLLRGVRILDITAGSFGQPSSILIEYGRIHLIGANAETNLASGTTVIDVSGRYAIPGLFDLHVHAVGANNEAFLAYGVTSVRDTGDALASLNALQDRSDLTGLPVPRYFFSGEIFEGAHPVWGNSFLQIDDEQDARIYVRRLKERGASFIKVYPTLPWSLTRIVADEAHRLGLPLVGHGQGSEEVIKSVGLGFFSLEHNGGLNCCFDDVLQMLADAGTRWDPTLAVTGANALLLRDEPERLSDAKFRAFTPSNYVDFAISSGYYRLRPSGELRGAVAAQLAAIRRAYGYGVRLLVGTDPPNPEVFFGSSLHWELARFVEAGLSPLEAIRLATRGAADAVGAADLGTVQEGKLADLVLLERNPLENIHNTETVWRVVRGGWLLDPDKLKKPASLSEVAGR